MKRRRWTKKACGISISKARIFQLFPSSVSLQTEPQFWQQYNLCKISKIEFIKIFLLTLVISHTAGASARNFLSIERSC